MVQEIPTVQPDQLTDGIALQQLLNYLVSIIGAFSRWEDVIKAAVYDVSLVVVVFIRLVLRSMIPVRSLTSWAKVFWPLSSANHLATCGQLHVECVRSTM